MRIYRAKTAHDPSITIEGRLFTEAETGHSYIAVNQENGEIIALVRANAMTIQLVDEWEPLRHQNNLRLGDEIKNKASGKIYAICAYNSYHDTPVHILEISNWLVKKKPVKVWDIELEEEM